MLVGDAALSAPPFSRSASLAVLPERIMNKSPINGISSALAFMAVPVINVRHMRVRMGYSFMRMHMRVRDIRKIRYFLMLMIMVPVIMRMLMLMYYGLMNMIMLVFVLH